MRVLVAEDEVTLADHIAEGLRDEGMAVDVALDGGTGVDRTGQSTARGPGAARPLAPAVTER